MNRVILLVLLLVVNAFANTVPPIQHETIVQDVDGVPHHALSFTAERGFLYRIQQSDNLDAWSDLVTLDGTGEDVVFPIVPVSNNNTPSASATSGDYLPSVVVEVQRVVGGGVVFFWRSLENNRSTYRYYPDEELDSVWSSVPIMTHYGENYTYIISSNLLSPPVSLPGSGTIAYGVDIIFIE